MSTAQEFLDRIHALTADSPYVVTETDDGFDLQLNIVDATWYTLLQKKGVKRVVRYEVRLDEGKNVFTITDVARQLRWSAGAGVTSGPTLSGSVRASRGRIFDAAGEKQWGLDAENRRLGKVVDYSFRTGEGHGIIRGVGRELGWTEAMPLVAKGALYFAIGTAAALVVVGIVVGAVALFG